MSFPSRKRTLLAAALLLLAACAAAGGSREGGSIPIVVRVTNDLIPRAALTIRVRSTAGTRFVLGGVAPGQTESLHFRDTSYTGRYVLLAEAADGRELASTSFALVPGATVDWTVRNNVLSVSNP